MNSVTRCLNKRQSSSIRIKIAILVFSCGTVHGAELGLCKKTETTIFSCPFPNQKAAAICAGIEDNQDFLEYRYGQLHNVEMRFRADTGNNAKKFHRAEVLYASNASELIWFQHSGVFYRIHMLMRGGPFLDVLRAGKVIGRHDCQRGWAQVKSSPVTGNKFIVDHGSGYDNELAPLWGEN